MSDARRLFRSIVLFGVAAGNAAAISCRPADIAISDVPEEDAGCQFNAQKCDAGADSPTYPVVVDPDADSPDALDSGSADADAADAPDAPDR